MSPDSNIYSCRKIKICNPDGLLQIKVNDFVFSGVFQYFLVFFKLPSKKCWYAAKIDFCQDKKTMQLLFSIRRALPLRSCLNLPVQRTGELVTFIHDECAAMRNSTQWMEFKIIFYAVRTASPQTGSWVEKKQTIFFKNPVLPITNFIFVCLFLLPNAAANTRCARLTVLNRSICCRVSH